MPSEDSTAERIAVVMLLEDIQFRNNLHLKGPLVRFWAIINPALAISLLPILAGCSLGRIPSSTPLATVTAMAAGIVPLIYLVVTVYRRSVHATRTPR